MLHGDDKAREMARSLLPAKNRRTARQLRAVVSRKDVTPAPPEAVHAAQEFLRVLHEQHGNLAATLALLPQRGRPTVLPHLKTKQKGPAKP